ncbi:hypothetical protein [Sphingopyxis sp. GW247-27LB]|uniref:hypothetical protein n=1 Tax=Sphingopyxis sp. GW247-27LB TaxID=2012632 RepID=UPI0015951430|nr:hypothetical protein [Sphingopyxis sp. GW247-27LB]
MPAELPTDRQRIVEYINKRADRHDVQATRDKDKASFHRGTATLFRALASDIEAELDVD